MGSAGPCTSLNWSAIARISGTVSTAEAWQSSIAVGYSRSLSQSNGGANRQALLVHVGRTAAYSTSARSSSGRRKIR